MKANYNHMNRMNRSNIASKQIRRTIRINRHRMELRPDDPPDIRRVLDQLDQQLQDHTEPEPPIMTVSQLYASKLEPTSGTYAITNQDDMDALLQYSKSGRNTKGVTFTILETTKTYEVKEVYFPVTLKTDPDTNSPIPTETGFEGTLKGNGATIHLAIGGTAAPEVPADSDTTTLTSVGMFGVIGVTGVVEDLTLTGSVNAGANAGAVGALAGYNSGLINKVLVSSGTTIKAPNSYNVGGIAGFNDALYVAAARGTIRNSANNGTVTGFEKVGGICGENSGLIGSCSNSGTIRAESLRRSGVGGIAGRNGNNNTALETGQIFDCCNTGSITGGTGTSVEDGKYLGQWVGGITGFQNLISECGYCYNAGKLLGYGRVHSIIGENDNTQESVLNCYGLRADDLVESATAQDNADGSVPVTTAQLEGREKIDGKTILDLLNGEESEDDTDSTDTEITKHWTQTTGEYPVLLNNYDGQLTGEDVTGRPGFTTVYLDAYDGAKITGDGKDPQSPFHNLADAVKAAGAGGTVILTKAITIDQATGLYDSVTYKRGYTGTDAMFTIDVPNVTEDNKPALGYLTMTTATIDGGGVGTLFHVIHGRLRLRGDITLKNCETAVSVEGKQGTTDNPLDAQVEVNYADIDATDKAIELVNANSNFILDAFNEVSISGTICLGKGTYISVASAISCKLVVESSIDAEDTIIAKGIDGYQLKETDVDMLSSEDFLFDLKGNNIVIS